MISILSGVDVVRCRPDLELRNRRILSKKPLAWACCWLRGIACQYPVYYRIGVVLISLAGSNATSEGDFSSTTAVQSRNRARVSSATIAAETVIRSQRTILIKACRDPDSMRPFVEAARVAVAADIRVRRPRGVDAGEGDDENSDISVDGSTDSDDAAVDTGDAMAALIRAEMANAKLAVEMLSKAFVEDDYESDDDEAAAPAPAAGADAGDVDSAASGDEGDVQDEREASPPVPEESSVPIICACECCLRF